MSESATLVSSKILSVHLGRDAYVYVRQSTLTQVREHTESLARQYELAERAVALGWDAHQVKVIDADLGPGLPTWCESPCGPKVGFASDRRTRSMPG